MNRKGKVFFRGVIAVLFLTFCMHVSLENTYAADKAWYKDYTYYLDKSYTEDDENYIELTKYNGKAKSLYIPAVTVIDGISYRTRLNNNDIWDNHKNKLVSLEFEKGCELSAGAVQVFAGLSKLKTVNVEVFDMSKITSTSFMFDGCNSLTKLNVADWDVSNVTNMFAMFEGCEKLTSLDVSKWDTSNVKDMTSVFDHCKSLTKLDVSNWDVSNVKKTAFMFYKCQNLTSLDLHKWNTSKVTNMFEMFGRCYSLRSVNLQGWDTSNVKDMSGMFSCNYDLVTLDLSSFDMSKVKVTKYRNVMFLNCNSLQKIKTPKNVKQNLYFSSWLNFAKKSGKKLSAKAYNYVPKGKKSITMECVNPKSKATSIKSIKSSKGKIHLSWKSACSDGGFYELQCSTNKKFTDTVGKIMYTTDRSYSIDDNMTERTSTTITGLTKGKTYYVRVRVFQYGERLSNWSKAKKIKVK